MNIVKWWVDLSYEIHPDCRSHTGEKISLGWGLVASMSKRQNINPRGSTEAELIGEDDVLPVSLCSRYFIEAQRFKAEEEVMYQDNPSAMLLKNNGRLSSGNQMNHIRFRFFLIKYRIDMGYLKVKYSLTGKMLADHFTKPFQGGAFWKFRAEIQGIPEDTPYTELG